MPSIEQLKGELREADAYDGPAPESLDSQQIRAAMGMLTSFPMTEEDADAGDWVPIVEKALNEFEGLNEIFITDGETLRWSEDVSDGVREELAEFAASLLDPTHVYRIPQPE